MTVDLIRVALDVISLLDRLAIPYAIGGSLASSLFGEPRSSLDADLLIALEEDRVDALVAGLSPNYYVSVDAARDALRRKASFNVIHLRELVKVDLFVMGAGILDRQQLQRRVRVSLGSPPVQVYATSPEDIVLRKLDWFRRGGEVSDRQWRDVLGVLKEQAGLDLPYLESTARDADLADLLSRAFRDAGFRR